MLLLGLRYGPTGDHRLVLRTVVAALHGFAAGRGATMSQLDRLESAVDEIVAAVADADGRVLSARIIDRGEVLRLEFDLDLGGALTRCLRPTPVADGLFTYPPERAGCWIGDLRVAT